MSAGWGTLIGGGLSLIAGIEAASRNRKSTNLKAEAFANQAKRRLQKGQMEADSLRTQGMLNQTSYAADFLSRGGSREVLAQDRGLDEVSNRASFEAQLALEDAAYEAQTLNEDASAMRRNAKDEYRSSILQAGLGALGTYTNYRIAKR